jgi:uncharacterized SAM-binding protein YcdF (DUF218 family)
LDAERHEIVKRGQGSPPVTQWVRWTRRGAWLVAVAVLLYLLSPTVLTAVGAQLIHTDLLERADAEVVLAPLWERVLEAADLYQQGYAPLVVITRASRDAGEQELIDRGLIESSEARKRDALIALGVPQQSIVVLEPIVDSTADEARAFAEWAAGHSIKRVIVITSPFHTARSRLAFMRALETLQIEVLARPASRSSFRSDNWWRSRGSFREGLIEFQKLIYYRLIELPRTPPVAPQSIDQS